MKIAISATEASLDSEVDPRFGRSQYFIIVEPETMQYETLNNPHLAASSGAGISAAQLICNKGVGAVLTGNIGPKAQQVLSAAGIRMLTGVSGRVRDAVEGFKGGKLSTSADSGMGPEMSPGAGKGRGPGMGRGQGMGMGRGMGCGGGKGMGMGLGRSGGGGVLRSWESEPWSDSTNEPGSRNDIGLLKQQAQALAEELARIQQSIEKMEKK